MTGQAYSRRPSVISVVQAATNTERRISQRSQIKEDTIEPSVPAREFNLKAYAAITWHNDRSSLGLEPRLADHRSQAAHTATLPTAPPRQAMAYTLGVLVISLPKIFVNGQFCFSLSSKMWSHFLKHSVVFTHTGPLSVWSFVGYQLVKAILRKRMKWFQCRLA